MLELSLHSRYQLIPIVNGKWTVDVPCSTNSQNASLSLWIDSASSNTARLSKEYVMGNQTPATY